MKKYLALLIVPALFAIAPLAHADEATTTDATTTPVAIVSSHSMASFHGGSSVIQTSPEQKLEVIQYQLNKLLALWKSYFGVDYPNTK